MKIINFNQVIRLLLYTLMILILWIFFTYKILEVPPGITSDEAAFGYNGALLANTLHDQNGRLMPFFVLSLGSDWRQPVTQYSAAVAFKLFGTSYFNLRAISVVYMISSIILLFYLLTLIENKTIAIFGILIFITTPIMMIQSHMGLDNIAPVPFVILWMIGLSLYKKRLKYKYLVLAGIALGVSFYSYKAMRLIVPIWSVLAVVYISSNPLSNFFIKSMSFKIREFYPAIFFTLAILPFFLIIPFLESKYPGAVFDRQSPKVDSYQQIFGGYLSNLDPSFLYITGDSTPYHSTGIHGALLLASLPFFIIGIYQTIRKRNGFLLFILLTFFTATIFFGLANSIHRASRLLALVPSYSIISGYGLLYLWSLRNETQFLAKGLFNFILLISFCLIFWNYYDFLKYYWFKYPTSSNSSSSFPTQSHDAYLKLSKEAANRNLIPAIEASIYQGDGVSALFFEEAYFNKTSSFDKKLIQWDTQEELPKGLVLLTNSERLDGYINLNLKLSKYHILVPAE